jgi:radical SAM/Cys-rich protein
MAQREVEIVASLPHFAASNADRQRGEGVFERSLEAMRKLNSLGYGQASTELVLNLVYNPVGPFLPTSQSELEAEYKTQLNRRYGIQFNSLFAITNMPINRYLDYLVRSGNYDTYMNKLINAYNPAAAEGAMCRNTLSVDWEGFLYDCDFNQMLGLRVDHGASFHIADFAADELGGRQIVTGLHCYGCTAGAGSSCAGAVAE